MSLATNPYAQYKQQAIATATPEKLLLMLFDGVIKFTALARKALENKDMEKSNYYLIRSQDIISELMNTLNMDYEISKQIYPLYEFIHHNLIEANLHKDVKYLDIVEPFLKELREIWTEAAKLAKQQNPTIKNEG